jgi:hypothetical protein
VIVRDLSETPRLRSFGPDTLGELHILFDDEYDVYTYSHWSLISGYLDLTRLVLHGQITCDLPVVHLTLPSLLYLSYTSTNDLSLFQHFTAPVLVSLDIRLEEFYVTEDGQFLTAFLEGCTDTLESMQLDAEVERCDTMLGLFPLLSSCPNLTNLTVNAWPLEQKWLGGLNESAWCPKLRNLTMILPYIGQSQDLSEEMEELAGFLQRRVEKGGTKLDLLTIRKECQGARVPYHLLKEHNVRKLQVTLPWWTNEVC